MAQSDIEINVEATGVSAYERDMNRASRATSQATGSMSGAFKSMALAAAGAFSARAVWDFTKQSVTAFATFEQAAQDLSAITGATGKDLEFFKNQAEQLGIGVEGGAAATLKAFELIGSAKPELLASKEALAAVTKEAIALSQASGMSLPDAAKSATSALNQYGAAASEASRYVNVLAAGALAGASPIEASTQALEAFGSVAKGFNVSIEESIALTQTLADKSIMGAEAGTALRNVLLKMQTVKALDDKALADLSRLGVNLDIVSNAALPMSARMKELGKITGDATAMMHVFGTENINAAAILLNGQTRFGELTKAVTGTSAAYDQAATRNATLMHSFTELQNRIGGVMMEFGESLKPVIDDVIKGFVPAMNSIREAFNTITSTFKPFFDAMSELGAAFGFAKSEGSVFASVISGLSKYFTIISIPVRLFWTAVTKITGAFAGAVAGMKEFQANSPILSGVVSSLLGPFTLLGDAISWVGDALGFGAAKVDATQAAYQGVVRDLSGVAKSMGATGAQTEAFAKSFDMASIAGLSQADAIKAVQIQFYNYLQGCNEATAATDKATQSVKAFTAATAGPQAGSIDALNAKLSELKKAFTATGSELDRIKLGGQIEQVEFQLAKFGNVVDAIGPKVQEISGLMKDASELPARSMDSLGAAFDPAAMTGELDATASKFKAFAGTVADTFASLKDGIKSMAIDMGYTISEAIGYAITAGGGFGDAIKGVLREMAVEIPKMAGMALLNAATFPGNSPIALPLAVAGAALLGLSGILSGVFKGADAKKQQEQQSIANNSGASSVPRAAQSGLAAFVDNQQNVGQQVVDALNGTKLVLQVGDQSMDAYVKGANKRNATRQGK